MCQTLANGFDEESAILLTAILDKNPSKDVQAEACQFGDVKLAVGGTVGDKAQLELDDILHLAVGKIAPEIEGRDQDGNKFKLSDCRVSSAAAASGIIACSLTWSRKMSGRA
jgi:hypothetical protein